MQQLLISVVVCLQEVSYSVSKRQELWSSNFKLDVSYHPPSVTSAFHYISRLLHLFGFLMTSRLNGDIWWTKRDIDSTAKALKSTNGVLRCPEISWILVHKRLKNHTWSLYSPPPFLSQCISPPSIRLLCGINEAPHSDSKWSSIVFVCGSDLKPQNVTLEMLSRRSALSGNTSLYCQIFLLHVVLSSCSHLSVMHYTDSTRAHHGWDTRTWRDVSSYLFTYLPRNYDTPVVASYFSK